MARGRPPPRQTPGGGARAGRARRATLGGLGDGEACVPVYAFVASAALNGSRNDMKALMNNACERKSRPMQLLLVT